MLLARCPSCFSANSCSVAFTKKAKVTTWCTICRSRTFFSTMQGLRGASVLPEIIDLNLQQRAADPEFRAAFDAKVGRLAEWSRQMAARVDVVEPKKQGMDAGPDIIVFDEKSL